jgi:hypothetical protein
VSEYNVTCLAGQSPLIPLSAARTLPSIVDNVNIRKELIEM